MASVLPLLALVLACAPARAGGAARSDASVPVVPVVAAPSVGLQPLNPVLTTPQAPASTVPELPLSAIVPGARAPQAAAPAAAAASAPADALPSAARTQASARAVGALAAADGAVSGLPSAGKDGAVGAGAAGRGDSGAEEAAAVGRLFDHSAAAAAAVVDDAGPGAAPIVDLGNALRRRRIDPVRTHVPEFAADVPRHLDFARRAILLQKTEPDRLAILDRFAAEADRHVREHAVTYEWWNDFNYRLSILETPRAERTAEAGGGEQPFARELLRTGGWTTEEGFRRVARGQRRARMGGYDEFAVAAAFPERVVIPTVVGDLPVEEINAMYGTDVDPIGMTATRLTVDGREMWPDHFYRHDHVHAANNDFTQKRYDLSTEQLRRLNRDYLEYRRTLPADRRAAFEAGYFLATHELPLAYALLEGRGARLSERPELPQYVSDPDWYAGIVPRWASSSERRARKFIARMDKELALFSKRYYSGR